MLSPDIIELNGLYLHVTVTNQNGQSNSSYKNDEFDWPFDFVTVT